MILQALKEYYDRKAADPDSGIAPLGWERKEIPFVMVLREDGSLVQVENTQEFVGKKKRAKSFLVPQGVKRSSGVASNLLWDNVEYVTGIVCKGKPDRVAAQHAAFLERLGELEGCPSVAPVRAFLASPDFRERLAADPTWREAADACAFVTFRLAGHPDSVAREPDVVARLSVPSNLPANAARCLVSGEIDGIADLHPSIKGVWGTNTSGGNIVSFNFPAACSFGKEQGANAPVGQRAAFEYTTALNTLLSKDSRQKMTVGDATAVFWSSRPSTLEDDFAAFFSEPPKDDPDRGTSAVERLLSSVQTGSWTDDADSTRFYVLGLAPNAARISVRFWHAGTVAEMSARFADWFENLRIAHGPRDREHLSLWRLLCSIAPLGKSENIPPNLAGAVMRAILDGTPYPASLLSAALLRAKAERDVTYPRAKLLKAILNRNYERNLTVSLDKSNPGIGYRLGRLFAVLERIQSAANPGINATIRDRFYAAASSTPAAVFGNLIRLKNHHLAKLAKTRFFEDLIGEILEGVSAFPAHLSLAEQGMFAIGYYHQRQAFFAKKEDAPSDSAATETI